MPGQLDVTSLTWDALFSVLPSGLGKQGWYGGWNTATGAPGATPAKLGVLTVDSVGLRRAVDKVLLPAFAAAGHPVDDENVIGFVKESRARDNAVAAAIAVAGEPREFWFHFGDLEIGPPPARRRIAAVENLRSGERRAVEWGGLRLRIDPQQDPALLFRCLV